MKNFIKYLLVTVLLSTPLLVSAQTFENNLYFGLRNNLDVEKLQEFLTDQGVYSGPVTGNFFSLTLAAVKTFQAQNDIAPAAGFFGPLTRTKVNEVLSAQIDASNQQAITETGAVIQPTTQDSTTNNWQLIQNIQNQILLLQQQLVQMQQQNQTTQSQQSQIIQNQQTQIQNQQVQIQNQQTQINLPAPTPVTPALVATKNTDFNGQTITLVAPPLRQGDFKIGSYALTTSNNEVTIEKLSFVVNVADVTDLYIRIMPAGDFGTGSSHVIVPGTTYSIIGWPFTIPKNSTVMVNAYVHFNLTAKEGITTIATNLMGVGGKVTATSEPINLSLNIPGQDITVVNPSYTPLLVAKALDFGTQTLPRAQALKVGSYTLTTSSNDVVVDNLSLAMNGSDFGNLFIKIRLSQTSGAFGFGSMFGEVISGKTYKFSGGDSFTIPKNNTAYVDVYSDIRQTVAGGTITAATTIIGLSGKIAGTLEPINLLLNIPGQDITVVK